MNFFQVAEDIDGASKVDPKQVSSVVQEDKPIEEEYAQDPAEEDVKQTDDAINEEYEFEQTAVQEGKSAVGKSSTPWVKGA